MDSKGVAERRRRRRVARRPGRGLGLIVGTVLSTKEQVVATDVDTMEVFTDVTDHTAGAAARPRDEARAA